MTTVADIMTRDVVTVTPQTSIRELADLFVSKRIGSVPVLDAEGALVGIVTESDLIELGKSLHLPTVISLFDWVIYLESEKVLERELKKMGGKTVADICQHEVITIAPGADISEAADLMSSHHVNALPVVEHNRLLGIVARIDIIRTLLG
ncbi:CBS domain-containing protein [Trichlorobacter ammonificans]|uniref:CBS domain protein sometimes clustered with YjeE n=1 Tax=Trichlorobacter ammonificans TaxID=2916410 RepID=A0ABM9DAR0_9BACT|nr:CBS domain-containing protein [Trichlorobacter ammonificans]CAH2031443.1 CBS domain protein sometimes clustered with YjeE [Trichlorobacter ammonificans]